MRGSSGAPSPGSGPEVLHPADHAPFWLFLRQERREEDLVVDVFYCARCLGRIEAEATGSPLTVEPRALPRRLPLTLGSALTVPRD